MIIETFLPEVQVVNWQAAAWIQSADLFSLAYLIFILEEGWELNSFTIVKIQDVS